MKWINISLIKKLKIILITLLLKNMKAFNAINKGKYMLLFLN